MSVEVTLFGRLGNNMFQYAFARIIAEHHQFALECVPRPLPPEHLGRYLPLSGPATLWELSAHFPHAPLHLPGRQIERPVQVFEYTPRGWDGQAIDLEAILGDASHRRVRLVGYFQRYEYFARHREAIRKWFGVRRDETPHAPGPRDVLINVRRGIDVGATATVLPLSYYDRVLDGLQGVGRIYVCGTAIDAETRAHFERYAPVYYEGAPIQHLHFMMRFKRLVLSNSTFAWWAAFLSDATEIYAPRSVSGTWFSFTGFGAVDLHMREDRYHEVDVPSTARLETMIVNRAAGAVVRHPPGQLTVEPRGGPPTTLDANSSDVAMVQWLVSRDRGVSVAVLQSQFPEANITAVLTRLVEAHLVSVEHVYVEAQ